MKYILNHLHHEYEITFLWKIQMITISALNCYLNKSELGIYRIVDNKISWENIYSNNNINIDNIVRNYVDKIFKLKTFS